MAKEKWSDVIDEMEKVMGQFEAMRDTLQFVNTYTLEGIDKKVERMLIGTINAITDMAEVNQNRLQMVYEKMYSMKEEESK